MMVLIRGAVTLQDPSTLSLQAIAQLRRRAVPTKAPWGLKGKKPGTPFRYIPAAPPQALALMIKVPISQAHAMREARLP